MNVILISSFVLSALSMACGSTQLGFSQKNTQSMPLSSKKTDSDAAPNTFPEMKPHQAGTSPSGPESKSSAELGLQGDANGKCLINIQLPGAGGMYGCPAQPSLTNSLAQDQVNNGWNGFWDNTISSTPSACAQRLLDWKNFCFGTTPVVVYGNYYPAKDNFNVFEQLHVNARSEKYILQKSTNKWVKM